MAITSLDISCDINKVPMKSSSSAISSKGGNSCRLLKINIATDRSLSSAASKRTNKSKKNIPRSPYLASDRVQLLSRVTEKRMVHKKTTDFVSSFPLAVNLYKASSDEFKSPKKVKKVKKSVLTLPNDPAPTPQVCTVSDMNESEYCEKINQDRKQKVIKKRLSTQNNRKTRGRQKDFEFYDRDARFCPQLNIDLDCSSTDMLKNFNGDGCKVFKKKSTFGKPQATASSNLSDVWAVLRNINKFQFRPSPPMSEESAIAVKSKSQKRQRRLNHKDARVIKTCHTEEFAYISSYEMDNKSPHSFSPSSSADRITVIDKKSQFSKICKEFEKRILKTHDFLKDKSNTDDVQIKSPKTRRRCRSPKKNMKALTSVGTKEHKPRLKKKKKKAKRHVDQQSKSAPTNSSGNRDSLVDAETLQLNYNSDVSSHKTDTNDSMRPTNDSSIYSDYSGSSKAELPPKQDEQESIDGKSIEKSGLRVNESSSVRENKEQVLPAACAIVPKQCDPPKRKPRLVTTMPSSCIMPKLTQTEIRRRLANIRFPIVVLGKDQVSSGIKVMDYDPPQFSGLDEHIWPFMMDWSTNTIKDITHHNNTLNKKCVSFVSDTNSSKSRKTHKEITIHKQSPANYKEKKTATIETVPTDKKKTEIKHPPAADIAEKILQCSKKQKSIVQLKDKMLNFLYKKTSNRNLNSNINDNVEKTPKSPIIKENKLIATDIQVRPTDPLLLNDMAKRKALPSSALAVRRNKKSQNYTYPWAKAKWASDFIENVIKKIRNGVYYSQEHKDFSQLFPIDYREVSVQTGLLCAPSDSTQTYDSDTDLVHEIIDPPPSIPGFNQTLPVLEIKTLNINQISVKHCLTNVMVQFDVTGPDNDPKSATNVSKNLPLIPLEVTESRTKVYKCKKTILNGMLPAEICSILPKMMNIINSTNTNLCTDHPGTICPTKTESCLSTITEQARSENAESLSLEMIKSCLKIGQNRASKSAMRIFEGNFPDKDYQIKPILQTYSVQIGYDITHINIGCVVADLLPQVSLDDLLQYEVGPLAVELDSFKFTHLQLPSNEPKNLLDVTETPHPTCTDLATYTDGANIMTSAFSSRDLTDIIKSLWYNYNLQIHFNLSSYFEMLKQQYNGQNIKLNVSIINYNGAEENIAVTVSNVKIDSLFKAISKSHVNKSVRNKAPLKCIEYVNTMLANKLKGAEVGQVTLNKVKRKGFYKLYRKCKSTTNIPIISGDKNPNTPLNKITTLDEFFQVLGSKKLLSSVFDGYSPEKILSSIMEMKNWITEINAKQALLILLLTNKKETQNLVRFRPIILQGIAVNRITRATELDMEIEVIERENLNKFSQYEGISYLPASVTNYDNLLEELYWIAKTTASDYQRPFDESSERLLKSLLEKRKKLNPSYLRVMARYVGLGLLKPPTKC